MDDFSQCKHCRLEPDTGLLVCIKDDEPDAWISYSEHARVVTERDLLRAQLASIKDKLRHIFEETKHA